MEKVKSLIHDFTRKLFTDPVKRLVYNLAGFNQYGLQHDDCLNEWKPDVQEAIRRLPCHVKCARNYRILRAMQLSLQKTVLPKKEWTKYEEDCRYLKPYLDEVRREKKERKFWDSY